MCAHVCAGAGPGTLAHTSWDASGIKEGEQEEQSGEQRGRNSGACLQRYDHRQDCLFPVVQERLHVRPACMSEGRAQDGSPDGRPAQGKAGQVGGGRARQQLNTQPRPLLLAHFQANTDNC